MSVKQKHKLSLISILCRICATENKNCIPVFGEYGRKQEIQKKIRSCLPVLVIEETDTMPKQICLSCLNKLDATWDLFNLCRESQIVIAQKLDSLSRVHYEEETFIRKPIEDKIKSLSFNNPITFSESATISLVPSSPPLPSVVQRVSTPPITSVVAPPSDSIMGVLPAQGMMVSPTPVTYIPTGDLQTVSTPTPGKKEVYPEGLIQVNPTSKQVVYQQRSESNQHGNQVTVPVPIQTVFNPRRGVMAHKPVTAPRQLPPTTVRRRALREGNSVNGPTPKKLLLICKYCKKSFPEDIIDHHTNLHLRKSFFTCLDCNKNFRSEQAMSRHRCGINDSINLDSDEEPICL